MKRPVFGLPAGTDVLLVNDTPDSAHEMIVTLYELGIGHLNLIPFEAEQPAMDLSRDKNAEEMKWSPLEMGAAKQAHGA